MGDTFKQSMTKTMSDFNEKVLPVLNKNYPSMKFVEVEGKADNEITKDFDVYAGIDVYGVRLAVSDMIGIASRIQRSKKAWRTFTVRKERKSGSLTEYAKRKYAISKGSLYPMLTMQAYIEENDNVVIGIVRTKDLIEYIDKCEPKIRTTGSDKIGQASFFVCPWDDILKNGYKVYILESAG